MMVINVILLLALGAYAIGGNTIPYSNNFDCKIPQGMKCKSLYEVNQMADQGIFSPAKAEGKDKLQAIDKRCCNKKASKRKKRSRHNGK